jgi:hypothetical protein
VPPSPKQVDFSKLPVQPYVEEKPTWKPPRRVKVDRYKISPDLNPETERKAKAKLKLEEKRRLEK